MLSFCLCFLKFSHKTLLCYFIISTTGKEHWLSVILPTLSSVKSYVTAFHCNHIYGDQPHWATLDLFFLCLFVCFYLWLFHIFLNSAKTKKQKKINVSDKLRQKNKREQTVSPSNIHYAIWKLGLCNHYAIWKLGLCNHYAIWKLGSQFQILDKIFLLQNITFCAIVSIIKQEIV